jgi:putative peptidoglycan lipid II flippase
MIPGAIGVTAFQINVLLTQGLAFWVGEGIVSSFGYAVRLLELPQGVFGVSLATVLLPTLSGLAAEKNYDEFRRTLRQGLGYLVFINLLAAVFLLVLAEPMIRLIFERGRFQAGDTDRAALALMCLAPGLVAFSAVNILARAFYALGDIKTPMRISIFCLTLNLVLAFMLVWRFEQGGIAAANSVSAFCNATLLLYALRRKMPKLELTDLAGVARKLLLGAALTGIVAWGTAHLWGTHLGHGTLWLRIGEVFLPLLLGTTVYVALAWWMRVPYVKDLLALVPRGKKPRV